MLGAVVTFLFAVSHGGNPLFKRPQFGNGMILQRGLGTRVFGSNATHSVTVSRVSVDREGNKFARGLVLGRRVPLFVAEDGR
jgi:hypothetical protein